MFLQLAHTKTAIFKQSKDLTLACYILTNSFPPDEKFAMISQIRRAAVSVHLNLAEGCSRKSANERRRFFEIARGSVIEIDAALGIAFELKYCKMESLKDLGSLLISNFKQLTALIKNISDKI